MGRAAINQRLIAEQLNLSPATVSKSFRNHPDIKPETRALVLDFASKLGYRATLGLRSKPRRSSRSKFVGVLFYDDGGNPNHDTSGRGFLTGLSEAAAMHDTSLVIHRFGPESRQILDPARQPAALRDGLLEGLILVHRIEPQAVRELATQLPTVLITHTIPNLRADVVDSDHMGAIAKLMDHLYEFGHRRIAFVGRAPDLAYSRARFGSYCQSVARLGLELRNDWAFNVFEPFDMDRTIDRAAAAVRDGVTAFICASDWVGYHVCRRLLDRGIRVPQDVSITGFDAMDPLLSCPQLTTVRVPFAEMGAAALIRLLARIDRAAFPALQTLFDCELAAGETTGPAR